MGSATTPKKGSAHSSAYHGARIFLVPGLRASPWSTSATVGLPFSVPPSLITLRSWCRNINLLSIAYDFRPRLRSRLTLGRLALPRNPWAFGGQVSRLSLVTHASILSPDPSTAKAYAAASLVTGCSPTTTGRFENRPTIRGFGKRLSGPRIFGATPLDQ